MKRKITIEYNWWRDDKKEIESEVQEILEEKALERIKEMWEQDFTSGELCENLRMTELEPEMGIDYSGHWSLTTENPPEKSEPCSLTEISEEQAKDKMDLVYLETPLGFHIGLDSTYIEQVGDFELNLPTGEILDTKKLPE